MRRCVETVVRSFLILLISTSAWAAALRTTGASVPGEVLVKIRDGVSQGAMAGILAEADEGQRLATVRSGTIWRMRSRARNTEGLAAAMLANPNVVYAEPNYIVHLVATPNDAVFSQLWGLKNTGQIIEGYPGLGGSDIDAEPAWNVTTGSSSIVIGVIDTGVDYTHPDLAANMWSNPGGKGNAACAAGTHGFDAISRTCDPMDSHWHGTHVAGTIGAVGNNGVGVTGINWTTSIMAIKFIGANGSGTTADAIAAIDFAVQAKIDGVNVRVLSNSWGGGPFTQAMLDVINQANDHDILFVAAAGNNSSNNDLYPFYPAGFAAANIISVAATDNRDELAYFSNYGANTVDLGAPGVSILSTVPGGYWYVSGTSMATPHVSGVAALLLATTPSLSTAEVKSTILNNTDPIPSLSGITSTGGRLNAAKVVGAPPSPNFQFDVSPLSQTITRGTSASFTVTITPGDGFSGSVALSVTGLPSGATGTFSPNPATNTSTLTITTSGATPVLSQYIGVTGVQGTATRVVPVLLSIVSTPAPVACPSFQTALHFSAETPASVATGDFNRDGRTDAATASVDANEISVRLGANLPAVSYGTGTAPVDVTTGDFDADGKLDLAVANSGSNNASILLGNGDGTFDPKVDYSAGTTPSAVAVGDFNNDGRSDLAVANEASGNVSVLIGNGDGTFAAATPYITGSGPVHLAVADFDGNGDTDLAAAARDSDQVSVLLGNGNGTFAAAVHYAAGDAPSSVAAGDLDEDGKPDLVVSNSVSGTLSLFHGNGNGTFSPAVHRATGNALTSVAIADFNDDAKNDLVAAIGDSNTVVVLLSAGGGVYPASVALTVGHQPNHISIADFDQDTKPDFVVSNGGADTIAVVLNNSVCARGCGTLGTPTTHAVSGAPSAITSGDFNRDGRIDVAAASRGANAVSVLLGNGDGTFATSAAPAVGTNPDGVTAADFNDDGALDLATANSGSGNVSVLLGNGDGTFQSAMNFSAGTAPRSVEAADFNRDGKADLVVATSGSSSVAMLLGNGDGTFASPVSVAVGLAPFSAMPRDFNRDGRIDLAVANADSDTISIRLGNGDGTFQAAVHYSAGLNPRSIAVDDFDRNGKLDLAVANSQSNNVSVFLGNGDGTFQAAVQYVAGAEGPFHVTAGDLTDDGIADLIVCNNINGGMRIMVGGGTGAFGVGVGYFTGGTVLAGAVVADVDRDGKPDLAIANSNFGNVGIMRNTCPAPDLTVTKTHTDTFKQGSIGRTYEITVTNSGQAPTFELMTMKDLLPPELTATSLNGGGQGWSCTLATVTCTRATPLQAGEWTWMTLMVNVAAGAPPTVTNVVQVSGGGEVNTANNTASDPTTIVAITDVMVTSTHTGSFTQGAAGKTYTLRVRNVGGLPTSGLVTVTDTLPTGLTATGIGGTGWSCSLPSRTCNRSEVLASGASYPPITLTVSVAANAPLSVVNNVSVTGGGDGNANNNFAQDPTLIWAANTCGTFLTPQYHGTGAEGNPHSIVTGNFNFDSRSDLAVTNFYSGNVSILLGKPDGSFDAPVTYPAGNHAGAMAIGYLTNDLGSDLVIANYEAGTVSVLIANLWAPGSFLAPVAYGAGAQPVAIAIADFNADGRSDVAVTNAASDTVSILLGNGNGTLLSQVTYQTGSGPRGLAVADFDGNGTSDLVVTRGADSVVVVLPGAGNGTFGAAVTHPAAYGSSEVVAGDFDGDGKQDLAALSPFTGEVGILLGNGNGTFDTVVYYDADDASTLVAEDLNGDGRIDLLLGGSGSLSTLFGNGDGTFDPIVTRAIAEAGGPVAIGDFNGDGRVDTALTSEVDSEVIVLLGGCVDLAIVKSHTGAVQQGGTATYSLTVTNTGNVAAQGPVTVTDQLPAGLTITAMSGSNWSCVNATATCQTSNALAPGASYPIITVSVNVAGNAAANVVNTATVSGGGDQNSANNTATDPTTIVQVPDLTIDKWHTGTFVQGQTGRTYTIVVTNSGGAPTSGTVTVSDSLPAGLVATGMSGTGWTCTLSSCSRSDVRAPQTSYPAIVLTVNVLSNAPATVVNTATVSGGGDASPGNNTDSDSTNILTTPANLVATALSATQVQITWDASQHATHYQLHRSSGNGPFQFLANVGVNAFSDQTVAPNTTYLYRVSAVVTPTTSGFSNVDIATTVAFTDDPPVAGVTRIKAAHVMELRAAVAAVRIAAGLPAGGFTDPALDTTFFISAAHFAELRAAVDQARTTLGLAGVAWSDPGIGPGTGVRAAHLLELRSGVR